MAALRSYVNLGRDRQRNRAFFSAMVRGVSDACEGTKILSFLFRLRLVCSSLLRLLSLWKVNCANFALCVFSEVLHSLGPMQQGFLCAIGDSKLCVQTSSLRS
jgi:hypothetical protein